MSAENSVPSDGRPPRNTEADATLSRSLAPLRVELREDAAAGVLQVEPLTAQDLLWTIDQAGAPGTHAGEPGASTLVVLLRSAPAGPPPDVPPGQASVATRTIDRAGVTGRCGDAYPDSEPGAWRAVCARGARDLRSVLALPWDAWRLALVDGPVESRDLHALARAALLGASCADVEFRTRLDVRPTSGRSARVEGAWHADLVTICGASLRLYVAALLRRDPDLVAAPDPGLVARLLDRSGRLRIRPIESRILSTSIDIGIDTTGTDEARPANDAVIYDLYGNSWHGD